MTTHNSTASRLARLARRLRPAGRQAATSPTDALAALDTATLALIRATDARLSGGTR